MAKCSRLIDVGSKFTQLCRLIDTLSEEMEAAGIKVEVCFRKLESAQPEQPDDVLDAIPESEWRELVSQFHLSKGNITRIDAVKNFIRQHVLKGGE